MKSKLDELKTLTKGLKLRVREVDLRPQKLKELKEALNATEHFVTATRVLFLKKEDDEKPFTDAEINALEKIVKETYVSSLFRSLRNEMFEICRHGVMKLSAHLQNYYQPKHQNIYQLISTIKSIYSNVKPITYLVKPNDSYQNRKLQQQHRKFLFKMTQKLLNKKKHQLQHQYLNNQKQKVKKQRQQQQLHQPPKVNTLLSKNLYIYVSF